MTRPPRLIGCARMYASGPTLSAAWRTLLHQPGLVRDLRVIATTAPAPIPPLVASPDVDGETCALLLSRFAAVPPAAFELLLERRRAAEQAGYAVLA